MMMKLCKFLRPFLLILVISACDSNSNVQESQDYNLPAKKELKEEQRTEEIEIAGTYSGIDNVGMESTIVLRESGRLMVQSSIGDGSPSIGHWEGSPKNLSLYLDTDEPFYDSYGNLNMGGSKFLVNARVSNDGLQIIGGKFYSRQ